jgi:hypothetical protein
MLGGKEIVTQGQLNIGRFTDPILQKELRLADAQRRITDLSGKVGSAHWPMSKEVTGPWDMRVHDADKWESEYAVGGIYDPSRKSQYLGNSSFTPPQRSPPRTPPRSDAGQSDAGRSSTVSSHSLHNLLTPEAKHRFRHHVADLNDKKKSERKAA